MSKETTFQGFVRPTSNFFNLPNSWTDITSTINSLAELKVIEYIMRHTWGFSEYDTPKKITSDEFMYGRKLKDGSRFDKGTGLGSKSSVIEGLKKAVEHGFIKEHIDARDKGRIKKSYQITMADDEEISGPPGIESGDQEPETVDRSEKDTYRKNTLLQPPVDNGETLQPSSSPEESNNLEKTQPTAPSKKKKKEPTKFDIIAAKKLHKAVSTVIAPNKNHKIKEWADHIRKMRDVDGINNNIIKEIMIWYSQHIGQEYVPEAHSGKAFRSKFDGLQSAMKRMGHTTPTTTPSGAYLPPEFSNYNPEEQARIRVEQARGMYANKYLDEYGLNSSSFSDQEFWLECCDKYDIPPESRGLL